MQANLVLDQIENMYITPKQMADACGVFPSAIYRVALVAKVETVQFLGRLAFFSADIPKMKRVAAETVKGAAELQAFRAGNAT